jgi:hypothetical protein
MKIYTVFFERYEDSPLLSLSGTDVKLTDEKGVEINNVSFSEKGSAFITKGDKTFEYSIPYVKGEHTSGRFRHFLADDIMSKYQISASDPSFLSFLVKVMVGGSLVVKGGEKKPSNMVITGEIAEKNAFFRYFGSMLSFLENTTSRKGIGHLYPLISKNRHEGETAVIEKARALGLKIVPEDIIHKSFAGIGKVNGRDYEITTPFFSIETSRKTDKRMSGLKYCGTPEKAEIYINEYNKLYGEKKNGGDKTGDNNILFMEVVNPVVDFYQHIRFLDDDMELHKGFLTKYKEFYTEVEPFLSSKSANLYGHIKSVRIFENTEEGGLEEIKYDMSAYDKFVKSSNPEDYRSLYKFKPDLDAIKEKAAEAEKTKQDKKNKKEGAQNAR